MKHLVHYLLVSKHIQETVISFSLLKTASKPLTVQHQIDIRILCKDVPDAGLYPPHFEHLTYSLDHLHLQWNTERNQSWKDCNSLPYICTICKWLSTFSYQKKKKKNQAVRVLLESKRSGKGTKKCHKMSLDYRGLLDTNGSVWAMAGLSLEGVPSPQTIIHYWSSMWVVMKLQRVIPGPCDSL